MSDTDKVLQVLLERGVLSTSSRKLVSLSTGLVGDDNVAADEGGESRWRQDTRVYG